MVVIRMMSLNMWGGKEVDALLAYLEHEVSHENCQLLALQECTHSPDGASFVHEELGFVSNLSSCISSLFPRFRWHFTCMGDLPESPRGRISFGLLTGVHESLGPVEFLPTFPIVSMELNFPPPVLIHHPLQCTHLLDHSLIVANFHGVASPGDKLDTPLRLCQSDLIKASLDRYSDGTAVILVGDFNLCPETESIKRLGLGMENLVLKYGIRTTRSTINPYYGSPQEQRFADYCFVRGCTVRAFLVPEDVRVSDHLPLIVEVSI